MRKLNRLPLPAGVLDKYDHNTHAWSQKSPKSRERREIWRKIKDMQGTFCAYCESPAEQGFGHIEHFYHKGIKPNGSKPYKDLTFAWSNLFGCCDSRTHCGHYKDKEGPSGPGAYDPNHIIKPDIIDPEKYLLFTSTGEVEPRRSLNKVDKNIAETTIRVLKLDSPILKSSRKNKIDLFSDLFFSLETYFQAGDISDSDFQIEFDDISNDIDTKAHQTAVRQALIDT